MNAVSYVNAWLALAVVLYSTGHWIGGTAALAMVLLHNFENEVCSAIERIERKVERARRDRERDVMDKFQ